MRLLRLTPEEIADYHRAVRAGDHTGIPGAVRASAGINTSSVDVDRFLTAVSAIAAGEPAPVAYWQDRTTGDYWPETDIAGWGAAERATGTACGRG
jgi:hypothetical protein